MLQPSVVLLTVRCVMDTPKPSGALEPGFEPGFSCFPPAAKSKKKKKKEDEVDKAFKEADVRG